MQATASKFTFSPGAKKYKEKIVDKSQKDFKEINNFPDKQLIRLFTTFQCLVFETKFYV